MSDKPRNNRSELWKYFTPKKDAKKISACNTCSVEVSHKSTNSNLRQHLRRRHPSVFQELIFSESGTSEAVESSKSNNCELVFLANIEPTNECNSESSAESDYDPLMDKRNKYRKSTSIVWKYFKKNGDNETAECLSCRKSMSYKSTTNNLRAHLKRQHPSVIKNLTSLTWDSSQDGHTETVSSKTLKQETERQETGELPETGQNCYTEFEMLDSTEADYKRATEFDNNSPKMKKRIISTVQNKNKKLNDSLASFFIKDLQSLSIVEDKGFIAYSNALNPSYALPSKSLLAFETIPAQYQKQHGILKSLIATKAKAVCLTIDSWRSQEAELYATVTAHFVTDEFEFKSVLLDCVNITDSQSAFDLSTNLESVTKEWELRDKVTAVITDNTPLVNGAASLLGWKVYGCYAHSLNLVVQDALKLVEDLFEKIKIYMRCFLKTNYAAIRLLQIQCNINPKELVLSDPNRWIATYNMLWSYLNFENAIRAAAIDDLPEFSIGEWTACKQLCKILKPFVEVMSRMSDEKYMSGGSAIVVTTCLLRAMMKFDHDDDLEEAVEKVHFKLKSGLREKFNGLETNEDLAICTFLDPRFKVHGFFDAGETSDAIPHNAQIIKKQVRDMVESIISKKMPVMAASSCSETTTKTEFSVWDDFDNVVSKMKPTGTFLSSAIQEIEMYLNDEILPRKMSPLEWWKNHRFVYPHLAELFIKRCNLVTTSVPCQRLFSEAGSTVEARRARLKPSEIRELIFLNANQ